MSPEKTQPTAQQRLAARIITVLFAALLLGGGLWLADGVIKGRKADDCMAAGSRACNRIDTSKLQ